jgi:hypothetical protein
MLLIHAMLVASAAVGEIADRRWLICRQEWTIQHYATWMPRALYLLNQVGSDFVLYEQ